MDELQGIALGSLGWSEAEFYNSTPRAFSNAAKVWGESEQRRYRSEWEQTRYIAWAVLAPNSKKKLQPTDLFKFEDEKLKPKESKPMDKDKLDRVRRKFEDMD